MGKENRKNWWFRDLALQANGKTNKDKLIGHSLHYDGMVIVVPPSPSPHPFKVLGRKDLPKIESLGAGLPKILLESGDNPKNVDCFIYLN